jgi:hypothetical protein
MDINTNFIAGKMNKSVDERLIPKGQYIDALNVRLGSTENTEIGAVENSKGNTILTDISHEGVTLSANTKCIGAFEDGVKENIYWFVHDPTNAVSATNKVDMILSYNTNSQATTYHVISESVLNFNPQYLITGIDLIEDLLFFTDDFNPPRKINVTRNYPEPNVAGDQITAEELNVIVKPPGFTSFTNSLGVVEEELPTPILSLSNVEGDENYIKDKFICFAYRYQYRENEYSATSLFTTPAFEPGQFKYDKANQNNEGMENLFNSVDITFNTGGPLVIAIELLFKESATNSINVIERFDKSDLGWSDNDQQTFRFTNSKIYTVLGSDELLRLYDNVPRFAKAQTIMGNRLIYGNYIDQYDIVTADGQQIPIDFTTEGSSVAIESETVSFDLLASGTINQIDSTNPVSVPFSYGRWVLQNSNIPLPILNNSEFFVSVKITSTAAYAPGSSGYVALGGDTASPLFPTGFQTNTLSNQPEITVRIVARNTYASFFDFTNSLEFQEAFGVGVPGSSGSTITPIAPGASYGFSLSDQFYALIQPPTTPAYPADYVFKTAGLWDPGTGAPIPAQEGYKVESFQTGVRIQQPSVQYQYDDGVGTIVNVYEYFAFSFTSITLAGPPPVGTSTDCTISFSNVSNSKSLHSNRNFETGIMYMDDFGRSTTVLVSPNNTVFFPASESTSINTIVATVNNKPPFWASRYKFFVKPSLGAYNIIYSDAIFTDQFDQGLAWVRLEGDATAIVNKNDILTVKIQSDGQTVPRLITTTVLEVEAKSRGGTGTGQDNNLPSGAPAGLYMLIRPQGFRAQTSANALIDNGYETKKVDSGYGTVSYPCFTTDDSGVVNVFDIPEGSDVQMTFRSWRGYAYFAKCDLNFETVPFRFEVTASSDATNFKDFFDQEGLNPENFMENTGCLDAEAIYYPTAYAIGGGPPAGPEPKVQFWFTSDNYSSATSELFLNVRTVVSPVTGPLRLDLRPVNTEVQITVNRNNNFMAFETKPAVADADLFYESSESYSIKPDINGDLAHYSNDKTGSQNQVISTNTPAIITLPFADCYTFGNGIESFRYKDLSTSNFFVIGERVSAVSNTLFEEADRFAGLTYSGVFSGSSNVNNLNEFNLGLVNFKDCELIFGPIMKLHARQTDILVLQEDRITYVLANKNLISDSTGGGAIVSVPEILGQQIARIEEYGISFNPESFTSWGRDMYFSDTKRGAIIKLTGAELKNDTLEVVSTYGMRSYFRNKFGDQLTTQKLGGYDPYMDEYVFSTNNTPIPMTTETIECGARIQKRNTTVPFSITVDVTSATGNFDVVINPSGGSMDVNVVVVWDGNTTTNNNLTSNTVITINKNKSFPKTATITVTPNAESSYNLFAKCVATQTLNVVKVVLGSPISGLSGNTPQTIHYEYSWSNGQITSSLESEPVSFSPTENVSAYQINTGQSSIGMYPADGSTVTMRSNSIPPDSFVFSDTENRFYVIPDNNLPASSGATFNLALLNTPLGPIVGSNPDSNNVDQIYTATSSAITIGASTQTLYLVWDFRDRRNEDMCYSTIDATDACIGCNPTSNCTEFSASDVQGLFVDACNGGAGIPMRPTNYFHNGTGTFPVVGDKVWKTSGPNPSIPCNQGVIADPGYYYLANGDVMYIQSLTSDVTSILSCP